MKPPKPAASESAAVLLEEGRGLGRVAGEQGLGHGEADAAGGVVVLAAVAAVGEVAGDGLALRLRGGGGVAGVRLDVGEDGPGSSTAIDAWPNCALHSIARRISCRASSRRRSLRSASARLFRAMPSFAASRISTYLSAACRKKAAASSGRSRTSSYKIPQLPERARLPGDISEPHLDRERFPVGILRRFRLARLLIHHAGLMPAHGDGARFVQLREPLARFAYTPPAPPGSGADSCGRSQAGLCPRRHPGRHRVARRGGCSLRRPPPLRRAGPGREDSRLVPRSRRTPSVPRLCRDAPWPRPRSAGGPRPAAAGPVPSRRPSSTRGPGGSKPSPDRNRRRDTPARPPPGRAGATAARPRTPRATARRQAAARCGSAPPRTARDSRRRPAPPPRRRAPAPRAPAAAACRHFAAGCRAKWPDRSSPPHPPRAARGRAAQRGSAAPAPSASPRLRCSGSAAARGTRHTRASPRPSGPSAPRAPPRPSARAGRGRARD